MCYEFSHSKKFCVDPKRKLTLDFETRIQPDLHQARNGTHKAATEIKFRRPAHTDASEMMQRP